MAEEPRPRGIDAVFVFSRALADAARVINEQQLEIARLRGRLSAAEALIPYPPRGVS